MGIQHPATYSGKFSRLEGKRFCPSSHRKALKRGTEDRRKSVISGSSNFLVKTIMTTWVRSQGRLFLGDWIELYCCFVPFRMPIFYHSRGYAQNPKKEKKHFMLGIFFDENNRETADHLLPHSGIDQESWSTFWATCWVFLVAIN